MRCIILEQRLCAYAGGIIPASLAFAGAMPRKKKTKPRGGAGLRGDASYLLISSSLASQIKDLGAIWESGLNETWKAIVAKTNSSACE